MIQLRIQWPNAKHELLQNPAFTVSTGDEAELSPVSQAPGKWVYEIPDGAAKLNLLLLFNPDLPTHESGGDMPVGVWDANQQFDIRDGILVPTTCDVGVIETDAPWPRELHPLIDVVTAANVANGAAVIDLRTEFVDLTTYYRLISGWWDYYAKDEPADNRLTFLGATSGGPPVWVAHCQKDLVPPKPETGAFVFFRPAQNLSYTKATDRKNRLIISGIGRYLHRPGDDQDVTVGEGTIPAQPERFPYFTSYVWLRCGMMNAVLNSGKKVVAIHPWPTAGVAFADAETTRLPDRCSQILRFMQGRGLIGRGLDNLSLGRLGIGGYSRGGLALFRSLKANRTRVSELYLFDPNQMADNAPYVIDWARRTKDFRLRMFGALHRGSMEGVRRTLIAGLTGEAGDDFISAYPEFPKTFWSTVEKGGELAWNDVLQVRDDLQSDWSAQHQFAVFGGLHVEGQPLWRTWLEIFLARSGFDD